jgi:hypothetical protein
MPFQVKGVVKRVKGVETPIYSPQRESVHWGVRDLDMSGIALDKSEKPL